MSKQREPISRTDRRQLIALYAIPSLLFLALAVFFALRGQVVAVVSNLMLATTCAALVGWMSRLPAHGEAATEPTAGSRR